MPVKRKAYTKLQCETCKRINYYAHKSKKMSEAKLKLQKYCKWCKKHTPHKEAKK